MEAVITIIIFFSQSINQYFWGPDWLMLIPRAGKVAAVANMGG